MPKVISGMFKGLSLDVFPSENMRPTSCRAKEALFDIIQFDIENKSFIDLFSGTGQIGIEALSRGASKVIFVEKSRSSFKILKKNIENILYHIKKKDIYKIDRKTIQKTASNQKRINSIYDATEKIEIFFNEQKKIDIEIYIDDFSDFLNNFGEKTDFLFVDAPFSMHITEEVFEKFTKITQENGTIIIESSSKDKQIEKCQNFYLNKQYKYGSISLGFYKFYK